MKISILTPTYNNAKLLDRLYVSIIINKNNSKLDIEWLIMDDGSTDNTKKIVSEYIKEGIIDIKLYSKENKGKMVAINSLMKYVSGELIIECSPEEYLTNNALNKIENSVKDSKDLGNIYAMVFLENDKNGNIIGNKFIEDNHESTMFDLYYKEKIIGKKALVYNTILRKNYVYKVEKDEKYIPEERLQYEMDLKYNIKCFNENVIINEENQEHDKKEIDELIMNNPKGYYEFSKEIFDQDLREVTLSKRIFIYKQFIKSAIYSKHKNSIADVSGILNKIITAIIYIPEKIISIKNNNETIVMKGENDGKNSNIDTML